MGQLINAVPNHGGIYIGPSDWTGNWSDPLMWDAARVPGVGDWVAIDQWQPIITVDVDADIGHSPGTTTSPDDKFALSVGITLEADQGSLIINPGITLRIRGDFYYSGRVTMHPGSSIILDASLASDIANTRYVLSGDPVYNGTVPGFIEMLGTDYATGVCTITTGNDSQLPIIFDGLGLRRGGMPAPDFNSSEIHATYTRFYRVGDATYPGIQTLVSGNLAGSNHNQVMLLDNVVFDTCGGISWLQQLSDDSALSMTNVTYKNSPELTYNQIDLTDAPALSGVSATDFPRIITNCVFDQPVTFAGSVDFELHDNIHLRECQTPNQTSTGTWNNNMLRRTDSAPGSDFLWQWRWGLVQSDNFYFIDGLNADGGLDNPTQQNPHWGFLQGGSGYGAVKDSLFWYAGDDSQGDIHSIAGPPDTNDPSSNIYEISGCISIPNLLRQSSGCLTTVLGGYAVGGTVVSHNNTIAVGHGDEANICEGGHHLHEGTDDFTGEFGRITSNIVWADPYDQSTIHGGTVCRNIGGGTTPTDPVSPSNLDYNAGWYIDRSTISSISGSSVVTPGYDGITFSAIPGQHDVYADPMFVDNTRNIITWAVSNGQPAPTTDSDRANLIVYAMQAMALLNDPTYNSVWSYANLLNHIRTGFTPKNRAMKIAHPLDVTAGFSYAGAMPVMDWSGYSQAFVFS